MKLYNTLNRKKEEFVPLEPGKVRMYVCGPTVYNFIHIGNARPYVVFDTVRRYFEYKGFDVKYVQNFTDVDDKIIKRANEEGISAAEVAERYIAEAQKDAEQLNVKNPSVSPRVTEEIGPIIEMIQNLIGKGFAYEKSGAVYFDTQRFAEYGKLSHKNLEELEAGARVDVDVFKQSTADFVLWKPAKPGEPKWQSPWGDGRPGWHIECSAMAKKYLGDTIDIHAGGEDLIFPHHENEVAQSEAVNGKPFANYWLHNGFINVDNQKMSKSKGNFFTLREIAERFPYQVIRFFLLSGHYRSPINFSGELVSAAENGFERIRTAVYNLRHYAGNAKSVQLTGAELELVEQSKKFRTDFEASMDDDFNTADAVTAIFELVRFSNINVNEGSSKQFAEALCDEILSLGGILGLSFEKEPAGAAEADETAEIEQLIKQRQEARAAKNWAEADRIRNELNERGVVLEDTSAGVRWSFARR